MDHIAGLDLPHVKPDEPLGRVLGSALESRAGKNKILSTPRNLFYWNADYFDLAQVTLFQESNEEEQSHILQLVNRGLLEGAYFIEKAGVGYMSKMALLAETIEERMLYALFSGDEVTHLAKISCFLPDQPLQTDDSFLRFLTELVESEDKTLLLFVLQVVLEGWGLTHYRSIAKDCGDRTLTEVFQGFLQDESRHHATGITLFNRRLISVASQNAIIEALTRFLQMIRVGPQRVVQAIAQLKGDLSRQQKVRIFA